MDWFDRLGFTTTRSVAGAVMTLGIPATAIVLSMAMSHRI